MKKTHLLLMLALCATLLASCSAGEPDVTQTQPGSVHQSDKYAG